MAPTIGLALGAGSARGLAHLGVLKAFKDEEISIDYLAGTSMGAIIGGFYAVGLDLNRLESLVNHLTWNSFTDLTVPRKGFVSGRKVKELFELLTKGKSFEELEIPFAAIAVDIERGEEVVIDRGLLADGMRASMSIPGIYVPYEWEGRVLVDGALLNRVPVKPVRDMGADIVIGVEVSRKITDKIKVNNIFDVIMQSIDIMQEELAKNKSTGSDILIVPQVEQVPSVGFDKAQLCIDMGYKAAKEEMPRIKELIEGWNKGEEVK